MKNIAIGNTLLKDVEIHPNINRPEEFELWIETEARDIAWPDAKCIQVDRSGSLYYGEENGLVDYYFIKSNDKTNYHWSSRAGVVNRFVPQFKHCDEVVVNGIAAALTLDKIREILNEHFPNQYEIKRDEKERGDVRYVICKK